MRILLSNDDGIDSIGITALIKALGRTHEVIAVGPDSERSSCGHSLTSMTKGIKVKELDSIQGTRRYSCSGTPADCVKFALLYLCKEKIDVVISGINNGRNLGADVFYSGTVAAAMEAVSLGVRAIAVSTDSSGIEKKADEIASFINDKLDDLLAVGIDKSVININYPSKMPVVGIKIAKISLASFGTHYEEDSLDENLLLLKGRHRFFHSESGETDISLAEQGYITVSAVAVDRNDYVSMEKLEGFLKQ